MVGEGVRGDCSSRRSSGRAVTCLPFSLFSLQVSSLESDLERVGWSVCRTRQSYITVRRPLLVIPAVVCLMPRDAIVCFWCDCAGQAIDRSDGGAR